MGRIGHQDARPLVSVSTIIVLRGCLVWYLRRHNVSNFCLSLVFQFEPLSLDNLWHLCRKPNMPLLARAASCEAESHRQISERGGEMQLRNEMLAQCTVAHGSSWTGNVFG
jgi:hypothetical protein